MRNKISKTPGSRFHLAFHPPFLTMGGSRLAFPSAFPFGERGKHNDTNGLSDTSENGESFRKADCWLFPFSPISIRGERESKDPRGKHLWPYGRLDDQRCLVPATNPVNLSSGNAMSGAARRRFSDRPGSRLLKACRSFTSQIPIAGQPSTGLRMPPEVESGRHPLAGLHPAPARDEFKNRGVTRQRAGSDHHANGRRPVQLHRPLDQFTIPTQPQRSLNHGIN
jgi:hypothetical protein